MLTVTVGDDTAVHNTLVLVLVNRMYCDID
jgi:hypothetical protein